MTNPTSTRAPSAPTGTVTFLFTDIEGSTALWERDRAAMQTALAQHHVVLRAAIEANSGYVFNIVGDAFCAAFATAPEALAAALAAQRALQAAPWGETPLRVRIGLHTGRAEAVDQDYRSGPTLNRVARVMALAHGGQILVSQTTAELVRSETEGITLRDMGVHYLKGLREPERILQLVAPDLPSDFPPLASSTTIPNNLPVQLTSFIGREKEIVEVKRLLSTARLVTLTGSGGTGKTRLALRVAADVLDTYPDGVWFVDLAPLTDPVQIVVTAAGTLGVHSSGNTPILELLTTYLQGKQILLVLDNCEHLIDASAQFVAHVLRYCTGVRVLATSRESLAVSGEQSYRVPSLSVPGPASTGGITEPDQPLRLEDLLQYESIRLFVERAKLVQPAFALTAHNAPSVRQICVRLDGIPLAIELAAVRVSALSPEQIATRLRDRFRLLSGSSRAGLRRQQTLHAAIDWSHDLLSEAERALLRRLSVFAGGWTLEAAEAICAAPVAPSDGAGFATAEVMDNLTQLVNKSLVIVEERNGSVRYGLLETIREHALEKLSVAGESADLHDKHLAYFVQLAEETYPSTRDARQAVAFARLESEYRNLQAAMDWARDSNDGLKLLRLCVSLSLMGNLHGHHVELSARMREALALTELAPTTPEWQYLRALTLSMAAYVQSIVQAPTPTQRTQARSMLEQALSISEPLSDQTPRAFSLQCLGILSASEGQHSTALPLYEQALSLYGALNNNFGVAWTLILLGDSDLAENRLEAARARHAEAARTAQALSLRGYAARRLCYEALADRDVNLAFDLARQSLQWNVEIGFQRGVASSWLNLGVVAAAHGSMRRAVLLYGATDALLAAIDTQLVAFDRLSYEHAIAAARDQLGDEAFDAAYAEGKRLNFDEAIALALEEPHG